MHKSQSADFERVCKTMGVVTGDETELFEPFPEEMCDLAPGEKLRAVILSENFAKFQRMTPLEKAGYSPDEVKILRKLTSNISCYEDDLVNMLRIFNKD